MGPKDSELWSKACWWEKEMLDPCFERNEATNIQIFLLVQEQSKGISWQKDYKETI